jgi:oxygen-independent coproporphyrinogen-3 oxidase
MWPYFPDLLARPVPRYTSFPTAAEFTDAVGEADMAQALSESRHRGPLSLYVHIPYCRAICWYCGCNTGAANRRQRLEAYLDALESEIDLVSWHLGDTRVQRIAFGGGSPNALTTDDFKALNDLLGERFDLDAPVLSVELDPRDLTNNWARTMGAAGVTRVSLGVQTFATHVQEAIGRVQPEARIRSAVDDLRANGVESINFDLMYGLPDQSLEDLEETLKTTLEMKPERIALFGYAHVPHMIPRQRRIDDSSLADQEARFVMAARGYEILVGAGYRAVGFDHFALPQDTLAKAAEAGTLRRNFQGFTEDPAERLIGLGATAISGFPDVIIQNEKNVGRYRMRLSQDHLPAALGVRRTSSDRQRARIIEDILCRGKADLSALSDAEALTESLLPFFQRGLADVNGRILKVSPEGLPYARTIAALFDPYRATTKKKFSSAI